MRTTSVLTAAFLLGITAAAQAQDPPSLRPPTDPVLIGRGEMSGQWYGTIDFGARASTVEGDAARFQRYRDLRSGVYANGGVAGRRTQDWTFEAQAWNIGYRDQRYQLDVQRVGRLTGTFLWDQIPLYISGDTATLYTETQPGIFRLEDSMQQTIQAGQATLHAYEDQAVVFDLRTMRKIGQADVMFNASPTSDLMLHFKSTTREGSIPFGGTFGFSNAVEIPAPVKFRTTDFRTAYEWSNTRGLIRAGWDGSAFNNTLESVVWENPLRFGPDAAGAPTQGRLASWPDNTLNYLHGTGSIALPMRGRLTGYLALGHATSNEDLLPFTINTAIPPPALARGTAEAESQMTIANFTFAMRPASILSLTARYRYSDVDVETPVFDRSSGSVSYDTNLQSSADASRYHSVTRSTFDADAAFDVARYTQLKVGYSNLGNDYTHRIWESTTENVFRVSADVTGNPLFGIRALYENRERTGDNFQSEELEHVGELPGMRHYDIADRNRDRLTLILNAIPAGTFGLTASIGIGRDEYTASDHGLQFYDSDQYSIGASFAPDDRYNAFASWGWENYTSQQRSRNASSTTDQANPARDWTTDFTGKVNFFETSVDINNVIERTVIRLTADWNKSNDTYLYGLVTGSPLAAPEQLPPVKNELFRAEIDVSYELAPNLRLGVAYWFDDYNVEDFALGPETISGLSFPPVQEGEQAPTTNALLLGYTYRPYTAHVGFVRLTYGF